MNISISHVHVYVDDVDAAVAFYSGVLGLKVVNEVENGGFRWVTLQIPAQPDIQFVLSQPQAGRSQEDGEALAALLAKGELGMVQFRADDLDTAFDAISSAVGADVVQEPTDQFWGARDAAFRDPAGNMLRIEQG
ncbi:MAG TPA: VOC family protein [Pseudolysinimonas sp.]|nr:VOC family protein [Pseudolysinimonas sp.]